jgi:uncharacterized protein
MMITAKCAKANERALLNRRQFLKWGLVSIAGTGLAGLGGYTYALEIEPQWVDIAPVTLTLPRLSPVFNGYRIAQISDIHMGTGLMTAARLKYIAELINAEAPDLVAITGDFVTHGPIEQYAPALMEGLSQLRPKDATVAVLGNHDHWTAPNAIREMLRESDVMDISNNVYTLRRESAEFHVAGVDDWWERQDRLDDVLAQLSENGAAVLLAHEPDYADLSAETGRFDLQISGHSHGGQVVLPFIGAPRLPPYGIKYPAGLYQVGQMLQYTNRGIGTINPPVRFNCRPEITVFTLTGL